MAKDAAEVIVKFETEGLELPGKIADRIQSLEDRIKYIESLLPREVTDREDFKVLRRNDA